MRIYLLACLLLFSTRDVIAVEVRLTLLDKEANENDWPWWRGPQRNGVASPNQSPPLHWSETENVLWKSTIPGRGHGSVTVVGEQVFLATADHQREEQAVIAYDRETGATRWKTVVHRQGLMKKNEKASQASSTIACDGERLFIAFPNSDALHATALSLDGELMWQKKISDYVMHQGYGASPAVYQDLVIVSADNKGGGVVSALDRESGNLVWTQPRPRLPNYASPVILNVCGRDQLFFTGCKLVTSFDPQTGQKLWEIAGATEECVTSTVTDGNLIYSSGGYPRNHIAAIRADGSGEVVWENNLRVYVPSMLIRDDYLHAVMDAGTAACFKADTGELLWKARLGGTFTASPVLVGDKIFATNESGITFIYKASPDAYELLAKNVLGDDVLATPTICGGRIYMRVAHLDGDQRDETLYCLGTK